MIINTWKLVEDGETIQAGVLNTQEGATELLAEHVGCDVDDLEVITEGGEIMITADYETYMVCSDPIQLL